MAISIVFNLATRSRSWKCDTATHFLAPTINNICVDLQTEQCFEMDSHLPKSLQRLLDWILEENVVQSWRFSGENNLLLSIRFTAMPEITTSTPQLSLSSGSNQQTMNSKGGQIEATY